MWWHGSVQVWYVAEIWREEFLEKVLSRDLMKNRSKSKEGREGVRGRMALGGCPRHLQESVAEVQSGWWRVGRESLWGNEEQLNLAGCPVGYEVEAETLSWAGALHRIQQALSSFQMFGIHSNASRRFTSWEHQLSHCVKNGWGEDRQSGGFCPNLVGRQQWP